MALEISEIIVAFNFNIFEIFQIFCLEHFPVAQRLACVLPLRIYVWLCLSYLTLHCVSQCWLYALRSQYAVITRDRE